MIPRPSARICVSILAAMSVAESAKSGVWATEPVLGLVGNYSTNPGLLYEEHTAQTVAAVLLDSPTTYHANDVSFSIQPSFRLSSTSGYSSLASDYAHLTSTWELDSERNRVSVTGEVARDSSLYYDYLVNGGTGVRRDTTVADVTWVRELTERWNFNWDLNSSRVIYGQSSSFTSLTDYHYSTAAPGISWQLSEQTKLTLLGNVSVYDSSGGATKSVNSNIEVGGTRQLTELWSLTADVGYSHEANTISEYYGPYLLGTFRSTNSGSVFSANLTHQAELLAVTATASRSNVPTGFAFLAHQTAYGLSFDYPRTARWTFDGHVRRVTSVEPAAPGSTINQSYSTWDWGLSAAWLFTEKWTMTFAASRVTAKYTPPDVSVGSSGFTIQLSRRFNRIEWH